MGKQRIGRKRKMWCWVKLNRKKIPWRMKTNMVDGEFFGDVAKYYCVHDTFPNPSFKWSC